MRTNTLVLMLAITGCFVSCGRGERGVVPSSNKPPGGKSDSEELQARVLRVYTTGDGDYRFVAYVVKWKDAEIIVSDPLARSHFQPGDTISFLVNKIHFDNPKGGSVNSLSFIFLDLSAGKGKCSRTIQ